MRESRVPKKSVFTRGFGVFCFGIPWGRCPAPKPSALPTALHPDYSFFVVILTGFGLAVARSPATSTPNRLACKASRIPTALHLNFWNGYIIANFFAKVKSFGEFFCNWGRSFFTSPPALFILLCLFLALLLLHQEYAEQLLSNRRASLVLHIYGKFYKRSRREYV